MSLDQAAAFFLFSLVAAGTPGPSNVLLASTGGQVGLWRGLPCLFGVAAGMGSLMFLAAFGLGAILFAHPMAMTVIRVGGVTFLLYLAWKIATAPAPAEAASVRPAGFLAAAALQWVNPKAWLVGTSAVATYLRAEGEAAAAQAALFALVFVAAALPSSFAWLSLGAAGQRLVRDPRRRRIFNRVMGLALAASVILVLR
jgi:threonine/homoserine/homoserine lactone efflux protein